MRATFLVLVFALALAGCGSGATSSGVASLADPSASAAASAGPSLDPEEAFLAFADCMREHGIDIETGPVTQVVGGGPAPSGGGGGASGPGGAQFFSAGGGDMEALKTADAACRHLLPAGGLDGPDGGPDPEMQEKFLAFAQCMRDHGIDMPDPVFATGPNGGSSVTIGDPDSDDAPRIDPESQEFKDAQEACGADMPGFVTDGSGPASGKAAQP